MVCFYVFLVGRNKPKWKNVDRFSRWKVSVLVHRLCVVDRLYIVNRLYIVKLGGFGQISFKGKGGKKPKTLSACFLYTCH